MVCLCRPEDNVWGLVLLLHCQILWSHSGLSHLHSHWPGVCFLKKCLKTFVCVYDCVHMCLRVCCACMCVCICVCVGQSATSNFISSNGTILLVFEPRSLFLAWNLPSGPIWLASQCRGSACFCLPSEGIMKVSYQACFFFFKPWSF